MQTNNGDMISWYSTYVSFESSASSMYFHIYIYLYVSPFILGPSSQMRCHMLNIYISNASLYIWDVVHIFMNKLI